MHPWARNPVARVARLHGMMMMIGHGPLESRVGRGNRAQFVPAVSPPVTATMQAPDSTAPAAGDGPRVGIACVRVTILLRQFSHTFPRVHQCTGTRPEPEGGDRPDHSRIPCPNAAIDWPSEHACTGGQTAKAAQPQAAPDQ